MNRKEETNNFSSFVKVNIIIMEASTTHTEYQVHPETVKAIFKALKEHFESKGIRISKHIEKCIEESMDQFRQEIPFLWNFLRKNISAGNKN